MSKQVSTHVQKNHPAENILGTPTAGIRTRGMLRGSLAELSGYACYTSKLEPKSYKEALQDEDWIRAM